MKRVVRFFMRLLGLEKPTTELVIGESYPVSFPISWFVTKSGKTKVLLDADHVVIDGDRIDIAPAGSRRRRPVFLPRRLPEFLGSRRTVKVTPDAVKRIRARRHLRTLRQEAAQRRVQTLADKKAFTWDTPASELLRE